MERFVLAIEPNRKKAGYLLYRAHIVFVILLLLLVFVGPIRPYILIFYIPFFYLHVHNRGCPITKTERRLHGEDITILDPVLAMMGFPATNSIRNTFQILISTLFMLLLVFILFP
uniref:DUF2784 family protein n=1 Tax=viral metagenome TaxID=1070528 RepID=A0A6C0I7N2_9ZZZZ